MSAAVEALQRQRLVRLTPQAWRDVVERSPGGTAAAACLADWAANDRPLVVTRQHAPGAGRVGVGLPAPAASGRQRIGFDIAADAVASVEDFPALAAVTPLLPAHLRAAWMRFDARLAAAGVAAHVYGSFGWQLLTGLAYLHPDSDVDILARVSTPTAADAVVGALRSVESDAAAAELGRDEAPAPGAAPSASCTPRAPRLDGEIVFADGRAVAWREWAAWRAGRSRHVLVKTTHGARLETGETWPQAPRPPLAAAHAA